MLNVICILEKGPLISDDYPVKARVYPANENDWVGNGPAYRRYFVILCDLPRETRRALRNLEPSSIVPSLDVQILIEQRTPRTTIEYSYPRLSIPVMPVRPYCTLSHLRLVFLSFSPAIT